VSLGRQLPVWSPVTLGAVASAWLGALGRDHRALVEKLLYRDFGPAGLLLTDSGTSALALALRLSVPRRGSSPPVVALPAWGCYDLATAADAAGARVVLYDVDPSTLGPVWHSLERAVAVGVHAVVAVHPFGYPVDMARVESIAARAGAMVIEDAAQAVGARYAERPAGTLAPISVLSFGRGKGRTGGRGGAILVHDQALVGRLEAHPHGSGIGELWNAAVVSAQWALGHPVPYGILARIPALGLGHTRYRKPWQPHGLARSAAAALLSVWELSVFEAEVRRSLAARWASQLAEHRTLRGVVPLPEAVPGCLRFPVLALEGGNPFRSSEAAQLGIMPGYPQALCDLPGFRGRVLEREGEPYEGARLLARRLGTLPTHSRLNPQALRALESWLGGVPESYRQEVALQA
jgi:hypothetical protein